EIDYYKNKRDIDPNQNRLSRVILRDALAKQDPYRPYLPSSPYYSEAFWQRRDLSLLPENHLWGPRDYYKSPFYTEHKHPFVSEIGYHGCPSVSSIKKFIDADSLWPWHNNKQWALHCTDPFGLDGPYASRIPLMANQIKELFGAVPEQLESFSLASQISQAEAKKFFVEMTRLRKWATTGIVWWNMIDGWPQFSDAVVDYYFGKKLAYHYLKRSQQDVCIMIDEPKNWSVRAVVSNDTLQSHEGTYRIWDADSGETLLQGNFRTKPNENTGLGSIRVSHSEQRLFLIQWTIGGTTYANHYLLGHPPISLEKYTQWLPLIAELERPFVLDV
ncbi:MAG: glycoside hydrolase family 2, partial [Paenibacillus sp.]|nr:glycoside hydrolase family 2 [Paenibacillus sp.]